MTMVRMMIVIMMMIVMMTIVVVLRACIKCIGYVFYPRPGIPSLQSISHWDIKVAYVDRYLICHNIHSIHTQSTSIQSEMIESLNKDLAEITGFAAVSTQPNSGAQVSELALYVPSLRYVSIITIMIFITIIMSITTIIIISNILFLIYIQPRQYHHHYYHLSSSLSSSIIRVSMPACYASSLFTSREERGIVMCA